MFPTEWKSLEPREFTAWVKGRGKYLEAEQRSKYDFMHLIRWTAGFIISPHIKKAIKIERYYPLAGDKKSKPEDVIKPQELQDIVQRHRDSDKSR